MKKSLEVDAADLTDILESFVKKLDTMSEPDMIDLAARLRAGAKHIKTIDDHVKDHIKAKLHHREGTRLGTIFKAVLKVISPNKFQQTAFKEAEPDLYDKYCKEVDEERITFEPR